jgi:hypothetical protein
MLSQHSLVISPARISDEKVDGDRYQCVGDRICTLYVVAERWILGCILRFMRAKNHFSDTLVSCPLISPLISPVCLSLGVESSPVLCRVTHSVAQLHRRGIRLNPIQLSFLCPPQIRRQILSVIVQFLQDDPCDNVS